MYRTLIKVEINGSEKTGHGIVQFPFTQKQKGGSDCGAFALHSAMGHFLSGLKFDQLKMRSHLLKCFTEQTLTPFPTLDEQSKRPKKVCTQKTDVYCTCLIPDTYMEI